MIEKLTDEDRDRLKNLNLFRFDNYFYGPTLIVGLFFLAISFLIPYHGWRNKPKTPPRDLNDYFARLLPYLVLALMVIILPIANWTIKRIESRHGTKSVIPGKVIYKGNLLFRRKVIIFKPLKIIIYRRTYHFMELKTGDTVSMELTYLRRLLHYSRVE